MGGHGTRRGPCEGSHPINSQSLQTALELVKDALLCARRPGGAALGLPALPDFGDFAVAFRATKNNHPGLGRGTVGMGQ